MMTRPPFQSPAPAPPTLTARQQEVAALVAEGLSRRAIATQLGISPCTVKRHVERVALQLTGPGTLRERIVRYVRGLAVPEYQAAA